MKIISPRTEDDFEKYYDLRWRILRQPWDQPRGSEKDELENSSYHVMAVDENGTVMGCGRLHFVADDEAQIRYMAVNPQVEKRGIGQSMLENIEAYARLHGARKIMLHARENAVGFYLKAGYSLIDKSHLLYDCIQHYKMNKQLN